MSKLVIFGLGNMADQAYFYFSNDSDHEVVAFTADAEFVDREERFGRPVVAFEDVAGRYPPDDFRMFVAIGYQNLNRLRASKYFAAKEMGYELATYVSSRAGNFGDVEIGDNCFILDNSTIQPCSRIGSNVSIWSNNLIGHHSVIEDHCYIAGQVAVAGNTTIGEYSFIGVNASIGHEITIGRESLIGAGAVVTRSVEPGSVHIVPDTPKYRLDSAAFLRLTRL